MKGKAQEDSLCGVEYVELSSISLRHVQHSHTPERERQREREGEGEQGAVEPVLTLQGRQCSQCPS